MNSTTLFGMALGLQTPWQMNDISFAAGESTMGEVSREVAPDSKRVVAGLPERTLGQRSSSQNA
jgi:hypothetical protein